MAHRRTRSGRVRRARYSPSTIEQALDLLDLLAEWVRKQSEQDWCASAGFDDERDDAESLGFAELVAVLGRLDEIVNTIRSARDTAARPAERTIRYKRGAVPVRGGWAIERSQSKRVDWDHPRLIRRVASEVARIRRESADPLTGLVEGDPVEAVVEAILQTAGIGYWRKRQLDQFGIDPARYCDEELRGARIVVSRPHAP